MKHTECKDCELSKGDCGYHFKMDGVTNYEIASLSACDQYGNCEFFKSKAKPKGDLISREALKEVITANHYLLSSRNNSIDYGMFTTGIIQAIDNAPTAYKEDDENDK